MLHYVALHYTTLHYVTLHSTTLQNSRCVRECVCVYHYQKRPPPFLEENLQDFLRDFFSVFLQEVLEEILQENFKKFLQDLKWRLMIMEFLQEIISSRNLKKIETRFFFDFLNQLDLTSIFTLHDNWNILTQRTVILYILYAHFFWVETKNWRWYLNLRTFFLENAKSYISSPIDVFNVKLFAGSSFRVLPITWKKKVFDFRLSLRARP